MTTLNRFLVAPEGNMEVLSRMEVEKLRSTSSGGQHDIFRRCSLAVLNCGSDTDDSKAILEKHRDFQVEVIQNERGIKLALENPPESAFVDGELIKGIKEHLFAVLRDIVYVTNEIEGNSKFNLVESSGISNAVFHILRNAQVINPRNPNLVVCWGGHSIAREEYDYTKDVGYQLGLRGIDICTGCGPGAMKGPMKGATIGHAKQRIRRGRYVGITEPGIIAAESPNPIVNELVILPDIEKRLEAFVRVAHGIVVFPGGAGTAEEILYLLGILLHPENKDMVLPLIFTGPKASEGYFRKISEFIQSTLGPSATKLFEIVVDDPAEVARRLVTKIDQVRSFRKECHDAYYFNWKLKIEKEFQAPFRPTHANMSQLALHREQPVHHLAANLRRAFSGIVAGNVKDEGIRSIEEHGHFEIRGDRDMMLALDELLASFAKEHRMKLPGTRYKPCYRIIS